MKKPTDDSACGDGPGAGGPTRGSVGFWICSAPVPKKLAVCGAPDSFTKVTVSPAFTFAGVGAKARMLACSVVTPIWIVHVLEPSELSVTSGSASTSSALAARPSSSHSVCSSTRRSATSWGESASSPAATTVTSPIMSGWMTQL